MTLPPNVPAAFRAAAQKFATEIQASFASTLAAQPEDQLKSPVRALIESVIPHVFTKTEVQVDDLGGRPDIGVMVQKAVCGHVELKAPGHGAVTRRFKGRDKAQWEKFKALPNILYTDAVEWALYRSGESYPEEQPLVVRFPDLIEQGPAALDAATLAALHTLLVEFLNWEPIVPSQPRALAQLLAPLCRLLRIEVATVVAREDSALRHLSGDIRDYLFPTASDSDFADIYAQTLTYSLLLARISGETDLTTAHAADKLESGHGLLATTLRILPPRRSTPATALSLPAYHRTKTRPQGESPRARIRLHGQPALLPRGERRLRLCRLPPTRQVGALRRRGRQTRQRYPPRLCRRRRRPRQKPL